MNIPFLIIVLITFSASTIFSQIDYNSEPNKNEVLMGLSEITKGLSARSLTILSPKSSDAVKDMDELIASLQKCCDFSTVFFSDMDKYWAFVEKSLKGSVETYSLILMEPDVVISEIHMRNLAHRLSLFVFFWNAQSLSIYSEYSLKEPLRCVFITHPRKGVLRVFYNQATSDGEGKLKLVNWYNSFNLGLFKSPLLPRQLEIYNQFSGRVLRIPVIHSPPWFFVKYQNATNNSTFDFDDNNYSEISVVSGRDDSLLKVLAKKMNFRYEYIDSPERTQGSTTDSDDNMTFSGGIGMIQRREADLLLGDVALTWERTKGVEFSFFTLADSGAFATHSPKRLNEALALIRPYRWEVWPPLIFSTIIAGPTVYLVIVAPYWWRGQLLRTTIKKKRRRGKKLALVIHEVYIREMCYDRVRIRAPPDPPQTRQLPKHLLEKCIWFTTTLFLRQSSIEPHNGHRVRFLITIFWLAATYVLGDFYSAQLTSQLAHPMKEAPINTLLRLEYVMKYKKYELFVERQSSSLGILENGTEIFKRLYYLMQNQYPKDNQSYLVASVEEGIHLIEYGEPKVILGGRETLYFNMKRRGLRWFQLSENLYTRYSAIAVQIGCPFMDSLNEVLLRLYEGGILEKMTNAEYEKMFNQKKQNEEILMRQMLSRPNEQRTIVKAKIEESTNLAMNLTMFQGAFIVLGIGFLLGGIVLGAEVFCNSPWYTRIKRITKRNISFKIPTKKSIKFLNVRILQKTKRSKLLPKK